MNRVSRRLSLEGALRLQAGGGALYLPEALPHVGQRPKAWWDYRQVVERSETPAMMHTTIRTPTGWQIFCRAFSTNYWSPFHRGYASLHPCNDAYDNQNPDGVTDNLSCLQHLLMVSPFTGVTLHFTPAYCLSHFQCSGSTDISLLYFMYISIL